jgi:hypothetical protein
MEGLTSLKKCCHCKNEQPLTCFYKKKSLKGALHLACKICINEYYLKNKEKLFPKMTCSCGKTTYKYYLQNKQNISNKTNKISSQFGQISSFYRDRNYSIVERLL